MILVCGATGNIGRTVVAKLAAQGHTVRALTRDPTRARFPAGVQAVQGDVTRPDSMDHALVGVERAFLMSEALDLPAVARNFVVAAHRAKIRHIVLNSSGTIEMATPTAISLAHQAAEDVLKASGIAWTLLRPGYFASNALRWASSIRSQGIVFSPATQGSVVPIDPRDIGAVAAIALSSTGHEGKTYVLSGPERLSIAQQVEQIGTAIGRTLRLVEISEASARAGMIKADMPEVVADAIMELIHAAARESESRITITQTVQEITGQAPRTFADWARDHAAAFLASQAVPRPPIGPVSNR